MFIAVSPRPKQYKCSGSKMYRAKDCAVYEREVEDIAASETNVRGLDGNLWAEYIFFMERKESHKNMRFPNVKPDHDNLTKSLQDGLESAGILVNDSRIISATVKKLFWDTVTGIKEPGIHVRLGVFTDDRDIPSNH